MEYAEYRKFLAQAENVARSSAADSIQKWNALEDQLATLDRDQLLDLVKNAEHEDRVAYWEGACVLLTMSDYILNPPTH